MTTSRVVLRIGTVGLATLLAGSCLPAQAQKASLELDTRMFCFQSRPAREAAGKITIILPAPQPDQPPLFYFGYLTGTSTATDLTILTNVPGDKLPPNVDGRRVSPDLEIRFSVSQEDIGLAAKVVVAVGVQPDLVAQATEIMTALLERESRANSFFDLPLDEDEKTRQMRTALRDEVYRQDVLARERLPQLGGVTATAAMIEARIDSVQVDLEVPDLPEEDEETVGIAVCVNNDDDDTDDFETDDDLDLGDKNGVSYVNDAGGTIGDNELREIAVLPLTDDPTLLVQAALRVSRGGNDSTDVPVYLEDTKTTALPLSPNPLAETLHRQAYFIEGGTVSAAVRDTEIALALTPPVDQAECTDKVLITVVQIDGPQYVPEFGRYQYTATAPGGPGRVFLQGGGEGATIVAGGPGTPTIQWGRGRAIGHVVFELQFGVECARDVDVIKVTVENPTPEAGSHVRTNDTKLTIGVTRTEKEATVEDRRAGGENFVVRDLLLFKSGEDEEGNRGMEGHAKVSLSAPNRHRGVIFIQVTFAQDITTDPDQMTYAWGKDNLLPLHRITFGQGAIPDRETDTDVVLYDLTIPGHEDRAFQPPRDRSELSARLPFGDTPQATYPAALRLPGHPRPARLDMTWSFRLAVVARIVSPRDAERALRQTLAPQAFFAWRYRLLTEQDFEVNDFTPNFIAKNPRERLKSPDSGVQTTEGQAFWIELESPDLTPPLVVEGTRFNASVDRFFIPGGE